MLLAQQLPQRVAGQGLSGELHSTDALIQRQAAVHLGDEGSDLFLLILRAVDDGTNFLALLLHDALGDGRAEGQLLFQLFGADVLAAGEDDKVLLAAGDVIEALKAQAVVLRTELYRTEKEKQTLLDKCLTQTQMKKKWGTKYEENLKKCQQAAQETKGIVLWYHETFAWTPFHQSSNGKTRDVQEVLGNADYPYITAKECPLDKAAEDEIQVHLIEYKEIQKRCREFLVAEEQKKAENGYGYEDFEIQEWDSSGYVRKMRIGETICTGDQFRDALKLPSSSFSFYESPHGLKIATVGKGHGFGMSQWTAQEMAKDGKNYEEILQYFYEGTELHHLDE